MLNKKIKVYLINLDRSSDRLRSATKNLNSARLPFQRISAVDGSKLDMLNMEEFAVRKSIEENKWITPAVIGCALSHQVAYKALIASADAEWGVILEDDIQLSPEIIELLDKAIHVINKTDVFLLYFHGDEKTFSRNVKIAVRKEYAFHAATTLVGGYSAGAYLIHRDVARRLVEYNSPVRISPDHWNTFYQNGVIQGLWALLPIISSTTYFGSDIGYTKIGMLLRSLESIRFLPFGYFMRLFRQSLKTTDTRYRLIDDVPSWTVGKGASNSVGFEE